LDVTEEPHMIEAERVSRRKRMSVGQIVWTREDLAAVAAQFKTRGAMRDRAYGAYQAALLNGWNDILPRKHYHRWEREAAVKAARQYRSRTELKRHDPKFYRAITMRRWLEALEHMLDSRSFRVRGNKGYGEGYEASRRELGASGG
jgi:hypothetical protein